MTTDMGICEIFQDHFQELFTREAGMRPAQFNTYLADFLQLEMTEMSGCEVPLQSLRFGMH